MSEKGEIEAIRARERGDTPELMGRYGDPSGGDRRALLSHVAALEARVARLDEALRIMIKLAEFSQWHEDHLKQARAALAELKP